LPTRALQLNKTASGLLKVDSLAKPLQPSAKLYNDLSLAKYLKGAPGGLRTPAEMKKTVDELKEVAKLITLLPDIRKSISAHDFSEVAYDISEITGLEPCVQGLANATSS
jgi:hypothetical protein